MPSASTVHMSPESTHRVPSTVTKVAAVSHNRWPSEKVPIHSACPIDIWWIASGASEFDSPQKTGAYIAAGLVLFVMTLSTNLLASVVIARSRSGAGVDV